MWHGIIIIPRITIEPSRRSTTSRRCALPSRSYLIPLVSQINHFLPLALSERTRFGPQLLNPVDISWMNKHGPWLQNIRADCFRTDVSTYNFHGCCPSPWGCISFVVEQLSPPPLASEIGVAEIGYTFRTFEDIGLSEDVCINGNRGSLPARDFQGCRQWSWE